MTEHINFTVGFNGRYKLVATSKVRGTRREVEFGNLILDSGLDRMGTGAIATHIHIGNPVSPATPNVADTQLQGWLNSSGTQAFAPVDASYVAGPPDYREATVSRRFAEGTATGNITEVGIGWSASNGSLWSRALVVDGVGAPTSFQVLADESLDVYYTLRVYPPTNDVTGTVNISGTNYNYVIRPNDVDGIGSVGWVASNFLATTGTGMKAATAALTAYGAGAVLGSRLDGAPTGGGSALPLHTSVSDAAYVPGTYRIDSTITSGLTTANTAGGIQCVRFGWKNSASSSSAAAFQMSLSPVLPKDGTKTMTLTFRITWARRP